MCRRLAVISAVIVGAALPGLASEPSREAPELRRYQAYLARQWFQQVGERRADETFGDLVARTAMLQLGKPYGGNTKPRGAAGAEELRVNLSRFECVSFVETTLAVARCVWMEQPDAGCFAREVQAFRYRHGRVVDYASRLHYFTDWIDDNASRRRVDVLTGEMGGTPVRQVFDYMSSNPDDYDGLDDPEQLVQILAVEARLSGQDRVVLDSKRVADVQDRLENGDVIAIVSDKLPGLMVGHTGFIYRTRSSNEPRYLHASSYHERVIMTAKDIAHYATRQAHRVGVLIIRPLPPTSGELARAD